MTNTFPEAWLGQWHWRGEPVSYLACNPNACDQAVVLVHGFGACKEHWRHTVAALAEHYSVYALDLMGFGASGKPRSLLRSDPATETGCRYGIDLWAEQVVAFIEAHVKEPVSLVGNSIGAVVALRAGELLEQLHRPANTVVLIDCAQRALDDKRLAEQPALRRLGRPLLKRVVRQRWLTTFLFQQLSKPGVIRRVLETAYPTKANVDDALVQLLFQPTQAPGAAEAFRGFINLFDDLIAPEILARLETPVHMIWGEKDPWEPLEEAQRWQHFACVQSLETLPGLGHCPHDEAPQQVNPLLLAALGEHHR
jgi:pimeloyl-ACP methyl ester carboxylesterase